jgi:hypothetical protein
MTYNSFLELMDKVILPRQAANPDHVRLDGKLGGGNREEAGRFLHHGKLWKIHADTRYEPLKLAYHALKNNSPDPFKESSTDEEGKRLDLKPTIQRAGARHMYIYEVPNSSKK